MDATVTPLPTELTTPPVTKMILVMASSQPFVDAGGGRVVGETARAGNESVVERWRGGHYA